MRQFENLTSDSEPFHLGAGTYRLTWNAQRMGLAFLRQEVGDDKHRNRFVMDFRAGRSRPLELPDGDYSITLTNGASGLTLSIEKE